MTVSSTSHGADGRGTAMEGEHYCSECGGLQDQPGVCAPCVAFEAAEHGREQALHPG